MRFNFFSLTISASSQEYANEDCDVISPYADHIIFRPALTFDGNGSYHLQAPPLLGAFRISQAYQSSAVQGKEALGDSYAYNIGGELLLYFVFQLTFLLYHSFKFDSLFSQVGVTLDSLEPTFILFK